MRKKVSSLSLIILFLFSLFAAIFVPLSVSQADDTAGDKATAGALTLSNTPHTPGDLFASVIYSLSKGNESADGVEITYSSLKQFPKVGDERQTYGQLELPGSTDGDQSTGTELASMLKTYYTYEWFAPKPKDKSGVSGFFSTIYDHTAGALKKTGESRALQTAAWCSKLFMIVSGLFNFFASTATSINPVALLGLTGSNGNNGWLADSVIKPLLNALGVTGDNLKILTNFVKVFVILSFLLLLIVATRSGRTSMRRDSKKLKTRAVKLGVIMLTIPLAIMLTNAMDMIAGTSKAGMDQVTRSVNRSYIVDTLEWAVYGNLDLKLINPAGTFNPDGTPSTDFEPTPENIRNLNARLSNISNGRALNDDKVNYKNDLGDGVMAINKLVNGETSNVNEYFTGLAGRNCGLTDLVCQTKAANEILGTTRDVRSGDDRNAKYFVARANQSSSTVLRPYLLIKKDKAEREDKSTESSEVKDSSIIKVKMYGSVVFNVPSDGTVTVKPLNTKDASSYLYGAVRPGNLGTATASIGSYTNDPSNSGVMINPETGKEVNSASDGSCSGLAPATSSVGSGCGSKEDQAVRTNSLLLAIYNRYMGMENSNPTRFSDQSTAFFLQSAPTGDKAINYVGYNTASNKKGEGKNTGVNGNQFFRYVMPAKDKADWSNKAAGLGSLWGLATVISVFALILTLKTPFIGAIVKSFKGFFSSLFTGNLGGLLTFCLYFVAMRVAFIFCGVAISSGVLIGSMLIPDESGIAGGSNLILNVLKFIPFVGEAISGMQALIALAMSTLIALVLCLPAIRLYVGDRSVRFSILGVILQLPYIIAEGLADKIEAFNRKMSGGDGKSNRFVKFGGFGKGSDEKNWSSYRTRAANVAKGVAELPFKRGNGMEDIRAGLAGEKPPTYDERKGSFRRYLNDTSVRSQESTPGGRLASSAAKKAIKAGANVVIPGGAAALTAAETAKNVKDSVEGKADSEAGNVENKTANTGKRVKIGKALLKLAGEEVGTGGAVPPKVLSDGTASLVGDGSDEKESTGSKSKNKKSAGVKVANPLEHAGSKPAKTEWVKDNISGAYVLQSLPTPSTSAANTANTDNSAKSVDNINSVFQNVANRLNDSARNMSESVERVSDSMSKAGENMTKSVDNVSKSLSDASSKFEKALGNSKSETDKIVEKIKPVKEAEIVENVKEVKNIASETVKVNSDDGGKTAVDMFKKHLANKAGKTEY